MTILSALMTILSNLNPEYAPTYDEVYESVVDVMGLSLTPDETANAANYLLLAAKAIGKAN